MNMASKEMNKDQLQTLARDLRKTPPHSPRETLGGFVIAARMLDKARADLLGINGEYNFYPCGRRRSSLARCGRHFMILPHSWQAPRMNFSPNIPRRPKPHNRKGNITMKGILTSKSVGLPLFTLIVCTLIVRTIGVGSAIAADNRA